jgi:hypothetical protein
VFVSAFRKAYGMEFFIAAWSTPEWSPLGQVVTAGVALIVAPFAAWQVFEARRTREEQARPFVVVDIQPSKVWSNILNLVIENVGTTLARDVKIEFAPEIDTTQSKTGYDLANSVLLRQGIPTLPPRRRIDVLFDLSHERANTNLSMRYDVTVEHKNHRGKNQDPLSYVIDLAHMYGLRHVDEYGTHHAAKSLREIEKTIKKWTGRRGRLNIWMKDEDEYDLEERVEFDLTGKHPSLGTKRPSDVVMALGRNVLVRTVVRAIRGQRRG